MLIKMYCFSQIHCWEWGGRRCHITVTSSLLESLGRTRPLV